MKERKGAEVYAIASILSSRQYFFEVSCRDILATLVSQQAKDKEVKYWGILLHNRIVAITL